jgi:hypothetical protein
MPADCGRTSPASLSSILCRRACFGSESSSHASPVVTLFPGRVPRCSAWKREQVCQPDKHGSSLWEGMGLPPYQAKVILRTDCPLTKLLELKRFSLRAFPQLFLFHQTAACATLPPTTMNCSELSLGQIRGNPRTIILNASCDAVVRAIDISRTNIWVNQPSVSDCGAQCATVTIQLIT